MAHPAPRSIDEDELAELGPDPEGSVMGEPVFDLSPEQVQDMVDSLTDEQRAVLEAADAGRDVIVDAAIGSGKTMTIQALCAAQSAKGANVLFLTYSRLLKRDAQARVGGAKVQNYHGFVYPFLLEAGIAGGISEAIKLFNENFRDLSAAVPRYDLLVIDEYQDIVAEYATLLENVRGLNPLMQVVMVGDMAQKVRSDTTFDVQTFAHEFCCDPALLPFTRSFRMGPELGAKLSRAWNKPIVGANPDQKVSVLTYSETVELLSRTDPGDVLCLGKRSGAMVGALNRLEKEHPTRFNKNTVYASVVDADERVDYGEGVAVFTTFDASKGLERPVSVVFDFDEAYWKLRCEFPNADSEVLRNIFLVAASRGKDHTVFCKSYSRDSVLLRFLEEEAERRALAAVEAGGDPEEIAEPTLAEAEEQMIGSLLIKAFTDLPAARPPTYTRPLNPSKCFDFRYSENVEACFDLLERTRLDDGTGAVIEVDRTDGLIDLSSVIGTYMEATFFEGFDAERELDLLAATSVEGGGEILALKSKLVEGDPWRNALVLTAARTEQERYITQVSRTIPAQVDAAIRSRLSELLDPKGRTQIPAGIAGMAVGRGPGGKRCVSEIEFSGLMDAEGAGGEVVEIKFVTELDRSMFLQLGLYLAMSGRRSGVLWNVRTDERWEVRVPDRGRFLNSVVECVSKQSYSAFIEGKDQQ